MSTAHEEALATLTDMFAVASPPWTEQQLDAVLRHHDGNIDDTVETVLGHGDGDPAVVVERLQDPSVAVAAALAPADGLSGGSDRNTAVLTGGPHKYRCGQLLSKYFPLHGNYFRGKIDRLVSADELTDGVPGVPYYFAKYDDGDGEHMAEDEIARYVIAGEFDRHHRADSSEDDATCKPPAQKRNRTADSNSSFAAAVDSQYVEGGQTYSARVTHHREVQSGPEKGDKILKFFVEWRRNSDVTTATTATTSSAMQIELPAVAPDAPPLSSSWIPLDKFIAPSAALIYLENKRDLPQWEKAALVEKVEAFRNQLKRDNTFQSQGDEPSSCGEVDFCCYLCNCDNYQQDKVARCNTVGKYHRGCCHELGTVKKLNNFRSCLGHVYEKFLKQTPDGDADGSEAKENETDRKRERDINNILNSRMTSAIARESRSDNDLALPAPESQRLTDKAAGPVNKKFHRLCQERKINPHLKREAVVIEVFAGIGGATVALKELGVALKTVVVVEHDRAAVAVHRANHDPSYGSGSAEDDGISYIYSLYETYEELEANLKAIVREIGPVDIIVGGPPCQDHSKVNALRKGADGVHGRYMRDFPGLISLVDKYNKELHGFEDLLFLVENVPGSQDATANYGVSEYRCDAAYFGPCHRDRIFYFNWQPDAYPDDEHPAGGTTCLVGGWMMPTMFRKNIDAKSMTLLASKGRTKDKTLFKFLPKDDTPINPGDDRPASQVQDYEYFNTNDRERLMGLPVGYVEIPIDDLYVNLHRAMTVGTEEKEWRDVVPPMYWSFLGLGPGGYTYSLDDAIDDKNDPRRIAFGLKEKNQKSKVCMKDFEYAWHLIGNGFSIPQVVFLLRPLQQLFRHRDYAGYTDAKYAWEDENLEAGNGANNPPPAGGVDGRANTDGRGASEEDHETGHHQQDAYVASSDDDNSL